MHCDHPLPSFHFLCAFLPPHGHVIPYSFTIRLNYGPLESILPFPHPSCPIIDKMSPLWFLSYGIVVTVCDRHVDRETCPMCPQKPARALTLHGFNERLWNRMELIQLIKGNLAGVLLSSNLSTPCGVKCYPQHYQTSDGGQ